jgi:peptidoglycan L-alanyl-D-glutamate endopeptidase CwlK
MLDAVSEKRIASLHPPFQALARSFLAECEKAGHRLRVTYGLRSMSEQAALYAQGRTAPGKIVTNAKPGQSPHNYGAAIDVVFLNGKGGVDWNGPWAAIGAIGEKLGLVWGGNFKSFVDRPHFEWRDWRSLRQAPKA